MYDCREGHARVRNIVHWLYTPLVIDFGSHEASVIVFWALILHKKIITRSTRRAQTSASRERAAICACVLYQSAHSDCGGYMR